VVAGVIVSVAAVLLIRQRAGAAGGVQGPPTQAVAAMPSASGLPRLVDLGSKSCIPCKMMAPILEELTKDYAGRFDVEFIDVGIQGNLPLAHRYSVRLIPTQVFLDAEGNELWRHEGFLGKAEILAKWNELGFDFE
jgi:thioredoxin 1